MISGDERMQQGALHTSQSTLLEAMRRVVDSQVSMLRTERETIHKSIKAKGMRARGVPLEIKRVYKRLLSEE